MKRMLLLLLTSLLDQTTGLCQSLSYATLKEFIASSSIEAVRPFKSYHQLFSCYSFDLVKSEYQFPQNADPIKSLLSPKRNTSIYQYLIPRDKYYTLRENCTGCGVTFTDSSKVVILNDGEYKIVWDATVSDLIVTDTAKLEIIKKMISPTIGLCINDRNYEAKGIFVFSSLVPYNADHFFLLDKARKTMIGNNGSIKLQKVWGSRFGR